MNFQINRCIFLSQFLSQKLKSNPLNFPLAIFFSLPKLRTLLDNIWKTIKAIITTTTRLFTYLAISTFLESKSVQIAGRMRTESTLFPTPSPDIKSSLATGVTYAVYTGEAAEGGGGGRATREGMPRQENQCHVESGYIHTYIHVACKGNRFADGLSLDGAFVRAGKVFSLQSDALRATVTRGREAVRRGRGGGRRRYRAVTHHPPSLPPLGSWFHSAPPLNPSRSVFANRRFRFLQSFPPRDSRMSLPSTVRGVEASGGFE